MTPDSVRLSRAGDQFHYLWAARRCLRLLEPSTEMVAIAIEGIANIETLESDTDTGVEVIDVAEYYGSEKLADCNKVVYYQLKHSTLRMGKPWTLSGLKKTLVGFAKRQKAFQDAISDQETQFADYIFLTNRPVADSVHKLLGRIKSRSLLKSDKNKWNQIKRYLSADESEAYEFLDHFHIQDTSDGYWEQRNILSEEVSGYLPGPDRDSADQLWLLITKKALPENTSNPSIRREDVLRVLKTDEGHLFPAPCLVENSDTLFCREQEEEFTNEIINNDGRPIIIHAEGGVGKSALARMLTEKMAVSSTVVLYDCFGNGSYRSTTGSRHNHEIGLVQIANELASKGLCHPLIPTRLANPSDYLKSFCFRLQQAISLLRARQSSAQIVIFVDAADNAQMAAEEIGDATSFPKDLLRTKLPDGIVLVCLSRTHRVKLLNPPIEYTGLSLRPFSVTETEQLLTSKYPNANNNDVLEFHRLSSMNPRVQATSLATTSTLSETLEALGPTPTTAEDAIRSLFEKSLKKLLDQSPKAEASQIEQFCKALAALRPFVPVEVLSLASGLPSEAIRSFITDLGRPLSLRGDAVQFFDEPSETWFRETYKPTNDQLSDFIKLLRPLTSNNSYVSTVLPQLMLEAGQYDKLIAMVLLDEGLLNGNPVEKRRATLHRLQFALKAAMRDKRYKDAAKLALKAGNETAGDDRQQLLIQENTDLVSSLLSEERLLEIVAQNNFSTEWHGGHRTYEAGLLSGKEGTIPDARNTLRIAYRWIRNWSQLSSDDRKEERITDTDIAEFAWARLNIDGPEGLVQELENWKPKNIAYRAGLIVAKKLVNLGRFKELDDIAIAANDNLCIQLAIIQAQSQILRYPPQDVVLKAIEGIKKNPKRLRKFDNSHDWKKPLLSVVTSVAQAAAHYKIVPEKEISEVIILYIPKSRSFHFSRFSDEPKFTILRANCLEARLANKEIDLFGLAGDELRKKLEKENHNYDRDAREYLEEVGPVFLWHKLWVKALIGEVQPAELDAEIEKCLGEFDKHTNNHQRELRHIAGEVSQLWLEIITLVDPTKERMEIFLEWKRKLAKPLFTPSLNRSVKICGRHPALNQYAFQFASEAFEIAQSERVEAEQKVEAFCEIARAIFALSRKEAGEYFNEAVEVAGKIGQEHLDYWTSILELANVAVDPSLPKPELAYRISRGAEVIYEYVARDKYFDWERTVETITAICPASAMTILSRWGDRRFGWQDRTTRIAINKLVDLNRISSSSRLAMKGFGYGWDHAEMLSSALSSESNNSLRKRMFDETVRYATISGSFHKELVQLVKIGTQNEWFVGELVKHRDAAKLREKSKKSDIDYSTDHSLRTEENEKDWDSIFQGMDVNSANSIHQAYKRWRAGEPPFYFSSFAQEFFGRVPIGQEANSLQTLFELPSLSLYEIRQLFDALPNDWLLQRGIKRTLSESVKKLCQDHFYEITKSRYYQPLPFDVIAKTTGISEADIFQIVVNESSKHPDLFGSQRLFTLAGLIATKLSPGEAQDVLEFGLTILEDDMSDQDGDGKWSEDLAPPKSCDQALAGYLWASLGAPETSLRWEAAHVVRLLCVYGETNVLNGLAKLALGQQTNNCHDQTLPFYTLAAKQWLLIALLRAVQDSVALPDIVIEFIRNECRPTETHVIIRGLASAILLKLDDIGALKIDENEQKRLKFINKSKTIPIVSKTYERTLTEPESSIKSDEDRYYFGYDVSSYWFESLGRVFSFGPTEIEKRALHVIRDDWGLSTKGGWVEDPRAKRGFYRDFDSHHSHGSYPKVESLSFYHSYHSMMIVAGDLIDTVQRHQDPAYDDELKEWISRHWLTRSDGKWLADRRDAKPAETHVWKDTKETDDWPSTVSKEDLANAIVFEDDTFCLWGHWAEVNGDREQNTHVYSALVSPSTSNDLLRALQTAKNPMDYRIPTSGEEFEIKAGKFALRGWVLGSSREFGIDEDDPWAGDISYPTLRPAKWFCDFAELKADGEQRNWQNANGEDDILLQSLVWGRKSEEHEHRTPETGQRLLSDKSALKKWLAGQGMDLLIEVQIRRSFRYKSHRNRDGITEGYSHPYTLIIILDQHGKTTTI